LGLCEAMGVVGAMSQSKATLLERVVTLNTYRHGERRAPHKPLLLLVAIAYLLRGRTRLHYEEVEAALLPLLEAYAPPVSKRHQPDNPYWYLRSDGLWEIEQVESMARTASGYPTQAAFRASVGGLPAEIIARIQNEPGLAQQLIAGLLSTYFPATQHESLLEAVGLGDLNPSGEEVADETGEYAVTRPTRDPAFREAVLRAYEYRCAFSGFRASLGRSYFGCEAAHVQWHAYAGPDSVANGLALEPTIHTLFDAGAWTLTDDRRILVSATFTGSEVAVERLRARHGQPLLEPLPGQPRIEIEYIRWHREPKLGGVFREPALPL